MSAGEQARKIIWIRRFVQGAFFTLFLVLLFLTRAWVTAEPTGWLQFFFLFDPLVLIATWISSHTLDGLSLLALVTLGITLVLGRVFCGWVCPLGTLHNMISTVRGSARKILPAREAYSRWQRAKYFLLFTLLVMALFGVHWIGVFDPLSFLYRSLATTLLPGLHMGIEEGATAVYQADPALGPLEATRISEPVYRFFRDDVFVAERSAYLGSGLIFLLFVAFLLLNLFRPRFWCRYVCPLGALLGLCSQRSLLRLSNDRAECVDCGLCTMRCPAAAQPEKPGEWLPVECFGCWNCVAACKKDSVDFHWEVPWRSPKAGSIDLTRRATLASVAGGVGGVLFLRLTPAAQGKSYNPLLIRPPGALGEREFLEKCIQCGLCMKMCPTNALHPTLLEAGWEGLWTPRLVPQIGYCDFECNRCGAVCPTGAIAALDLPAKKECRIGLAIFDTGRCLPYAYGRDCIVCEEHCPTPTKAIYFVETEVRMRDGTTRVLKQPRVDPDLCIGCGICENVCPFKDQPAVRITSAGESRNPENQPVLPAVEADPYAGGYGGP